MVGKEPHLPSLTDPQKRKHRGAVATDGRHLSSRDGHRTDSLHSGIPNLSLWEGNRDDYCGGTRRMFEEEPGAHLAGRYKLGDVSYSGRVQAPLGG